MHVDLARVVSREDLSNGEGITEVSSNKRGCLPSNILDRVGEVETLNPLEYFSRKASLHHNCFSFKLLNLKWRHLQKSSGLINTTKHVSL